MQEYGGLGRGLPQRIWQAEAAASARARAARAATAEASVRAAAAGDSVVLATFDGYVDAQEARARSLEQRATTAERGRDVLAQSFARADSIGRSRGRAVDALEGYVADLEVALEARTEDARKWEAAAGGTMFGIRIEPEVALAVGVVTGILGLRGRPGRLPSSRSGELEFRLPRHQVALSRLRRQWS